MYLGEKKNATMVGLGDPRLGLKKTFWSSRVHKWRFFVFYKKKFFMKRNANFFKKNMKVNSIQKKSKMEFFNSISIGKKIKKRR